MNRFTHFTPFINDQSSDLEFKVKIKNNPNKNHNYFWKLCTLKRPIKLKFSSRLQQNCFGIAEEWSYRCDTDS